MPLSVLTQRVCVCARRHFPDAGTGQGKSNTQGELRTLVKTRAITKPVGLPAWPPRHRPFSLGCLRWASHQIFVLLLLPRGWVGAGREGPPAEPISCFHDEGALFTQEISGKENHMHSGQGREGVPVAETGDGVKGTDLQFTMDKSWGGSVPHADYRSEDWCMFESC